MDATKGSGDAILRKEETRRMAEARAFARHLSSYASFKLHELGLTIRGNLKILMYLPSVVNNWMKIVLLLGI